MTKKNTSKKAVKDSNMNTMSGEFKETKTKTETEKVVSETKVTVKDESKVETNKKTQSNTKSIVIAIRVDLSRQGKIVNIQSGLETPIVFIEKANLSPVTLTAIPVKYEVVEGKEMKASVLKALSSDNVKYVKYLFETRYKAAPIGIKDEMFWCHGRINGATFNDNDLIGFLIIEE